MRNKIKYLKKSRTSEYSFSYNNNPCKMCVFSILISTVVTIIWCRNL